MNASSRTRDHGRTSSVGSSGGKLDIERIRRLAAEDDATIPLMTGDQAQAVVQVLGTRRPLTLTTAR